MQFKYLYIIYQMFKFNKFLVKIFYYFKKLMKNKKKQLKDIYVEGNNVYLVMEYCCLDLSHLIFYFYNEMTYIHKLLIMHQILKGIQYLHKL